MKTTIIASILLFFFSLSYSQTRGKIVCEWAPEEPIGYGWLRWDGEEEPEMWKRFGTVAHHIWEIHSGGWHIADGDKDIVPDYIIWRNDNLNAPSVYDAMKLAYNYFIKHPNKREYWHKDFIITVFEKNGSDY